MIMSRCSRPHLMRSCLLAIVAGASLLFGLTGPLAAADPLKDNTSLQFVPENVAFYATELRLKELFDKFAGSKAFAKLKEMPSIQMGWMMAMSQWENPQVPQIATAKQMLAQPENQQLVSVLKDAISTEIFVYGGEEFGNALVLFNELNAASTAAQMEAAASGDMEQMPAIQMRKMIEALDRQGDKLKVPTLVIGARLTDTKAALAQLARLEAIVQAVTAQQPQLQNAYKRDKVGGADLLTLTLDGATVPWPMLLQNAEGLPADQAQKIAAKLATLKLVIAIGLRNNDLLISLGPDTQHLASLGQGKLLYDRAEMAPIQKAADKPITSVAYVSAQFAQQAGTIDAQLDQFTGVAKQALSASGLSSELTTEMATDIDKLGTYVKANMPKPSATSGYSYLTPEGFEAYAYNWTTESQWDPSQKLTILNRLGGDPIAFFAGRGKNDPQDVDMLGTLVERSVYYIEKVLVETGDSSQAEAVTKLSDAMSPFLAELSKVTKEQLVPAFADGQSALVLDAKLTSYAWHADLPPSDEPLPMLELGVLLGVSDAEQAKAGFSAYFDIAQRVLNKLHELSTGELKDLFNEEFPEIELTSPKSQSFDGATVYYYALPAEARLDARLAPNAGLSKDTLALTYLPKFTARLLKDTPLKGQGPLANVDRPLAAAGQLDFARFIDALTPWIDYGMKLNGADGEDGPLGNMSQQVHDVLDVFKCFRGFSSVTYLEGNALTTHSLWRFEDLQ